MAIKDLAYMAGIMARTYMSKNQKIFKNTNKHVKKHNFILSF
jgi:hypothetical protein